MIEEQIVFNKTVLEILAEQKDRIEQLEAEVKLLKSKQPFRSTGKGKNIETPSKGKPEFFA
jgi:hypothetical protein